MIKELTCSSFASFIIHLTLFCVFRPIIHLTLFWTLGPCLGMCVYGPPCWDALLPLRLFVTFIKNNTGSPYGTRIQKCLLATYHPCCTVYWWLLVYFPPGNETIYNINVGNFPRLWNTAGVNFSSLNLEKLIGLHTINNPSRIFLVYLEGTSPSIKLLPQRRMGRMRNLLFSSKLDLSHHY